MVKAAVPPVAGTDRGPARPVPVTSATVTVVDALVTVFPPESWITTTGCLARAAPEGPPVGWVRTASRLADPTPLTETIFEVAVAVLPASAANVAPVEVKRRT